MRRGRGEEGAGDLCRVFLLSYISFKQFVNLDDFNICFLCVFFQVFTFLQNLRLL